MISVHYTFDLRQPVWRAQIYYHKKQNQTNLNSQRPTISSLATQKSQASERPQKQDVAIFQLFDQHVFSFLYYSRWPTSAATFLSCVWAESI